MASSTVNGGGEAMTSTEAAVVIHHTPMSERQQLALIKRLEKANASSPRPANAQPDSLLISPPRAPLQVVTDANGGNVGSQLSSGSSSSTGSSTTSNSGSATPNSASLRRSIFPNSPTVDRLLKKISKKNTKGETPLHTAAIRGSSRLVRQLLQMGADPNAQDNAEWSALHEACNRGNIAVVRVLKEFGADLNLQGFGRDSPLHDAARNGHLKVVKFLTRSGANLRGKNASGRTPREEAEVTRLRITENDELDKTIAYLIEHEDDCRPHSSNSSDISSDEGESDDEAENNDLAKFLGVSKSPVVQQALQTLSLASTPPNHRGRGQKAASVKSAATTPRAAKSDMMAAPTTKIRLTYDSDCNIIAKATTTGDTIKTTKAIVDLERKKVNNQRPVAVIPGVKRGSASTFEPSQESKRIKVEAVVASAEADEIKRVVPEPNIVPEETKEETKPQPSKQQANEELKVPPLKICLNKTTTGKVNEENTYVETTNQEETSGILTVDSTIPKEDEDDDDDEEGDDENKKYHLKSEAAEDDSVAVDDDVSIRLTRSKITEVVSEVAPNSVPSPIPTTSAISVGSSSTTSSSDLPPEYYMKKRKLRMSSEGGRPTPLNDIEKYLQIRRQVEQRRKNVFPVQPKPPHGFKDYLMNKKTYLLRGNAHERLRSMPMIQPPPSLEGPLRDLFIQQEDERFKLRTKHIVEKEKLVLAVEQEILRVHGRAARALANQSVPFSVCTMLRDEDIYNTLDNRSSAHEDTNNSNKDVRSRYNGRLFLSWLQDVDDKWEKIKEQMVLRHHNEAESLNAVQKMDWEWKINEISGVTTNMSSLAQIDDLHIPMVHVSDDFDLSNS